MLGDWARSFALAPPKLLPFASLRRREFTLLDVGCGNHGAQVVRRWMPRCRYFGIDKGVYANDARDFALMEKFYDLDLAVSDLSEVPDSAFDVVIFSHVIEHLTNGLEVVGRLAGKLAPGGEIYIEFPSVRSLSLPNWRESLHFCDDDTHVRLYTVPEVANALLARGLTIRRAGRRRRWRRALLTPLAAARMYWKNGWVPGGVFWDLLGFADYVWAKRPAAAGSSPARP